MNKPLFPADFVPAVRPADGGWIMRGNNALWLVALLWLECALIMTAHSWPRFAVLQFNDPDDSMRLVQVRDFIAGQGWFDVSQHRVNPPTGGPMHWSRLLDVPIAAIIVGLRPFVGQHVAEIVACVTVPLATLASMCFALFLSLRRFFGVHRALLTVALLVTSFPILVQISPLRVDHHGWQIVMAAIMLGGVIAERPLRGGLLAGCAMAMWLHISTEGIPDAVFAGVVVSLRYVWRDREWPRLAGYVAGLAGATVLLALGVRGWDATMEFHCDGMTIAYIPEFLLLGAIMFAGRRVLGGGTLLRRIAVPALGGLVAAALYATASRPCLGGPFYFLDPLVYNVWYLGVLEGLPFWQQGASMAAIILVPGIVGLIGLGCALIAERDSERRAQWLSILGLALPAFAMSCLMLRAMSFAHLFALVGNAWIIAALYPRVGAQARMMTRVILTVALALLAPAPLALGASEAATGLWGGNAATEAPKTESCLAPGQIEALNRLPTSTLLAPVDLGPAILQRTPHSVVATGHHRNAAGLAKVIHAFVGTPEEAHSILRSSDVRYLLFCPSFNEMKRYAKVAPDGFDARMMKGQRPDWLIPVQVPGATALQVYRVAY